MNIRLALRIGLEKFLHLLEGNCGIQEIVSVKKSKQVIEEQQLHILNIKFSVINEAFRPSKWPPLFLSGQWKLTEVAKHVRQPFKFFIIAIDKILPGKFAHCG